MVKFVLVGLLSVIAVAAQGKESPGLVIELDDYWLAIAPSEVFDSALLRVAGPDGFELTATSDEKAIAINMLTEGRLGEAASNPDAELTGIPDGAYFFELQLDSVGSAQHSLEGRFDVLSGELVDLALVSEAGGDDEPLNPKDPAGQFAFEDDWVVVRDNLIDGGTQLYLESSAGTDLGVANVAGKLGFGTREGTYSSGLTKRFMTILPTGSVGIGTTLPQADLHIFRPGGNIRITDSDVCPNPNAAWEMEEDFGRLKFEVVANCPGDSVGGKFYILGNGNIGIGTNNPVTSLQVDSTTPALRLNDTSNGAGQVSLNMNTNRLIIEGNSGQAVASIDTRAPSNALWLDQNGNLGIGGASFGAALEIRRPNGRVHVNDTNGSAAPRTLFRLTNRGNTKFEIEELLSGTSWAFTNSGNDFRMSLQGSGTVEFRVDNNGDAFLAGALTQNSDVEAKQSIRAVDASSILDRVAALPISQWQYKDAPGVDHMGPMAQDFHASFGLGATKRGISSLDTGGVALAAIQALNQRLEEQVASLEAGRRALALRNDEHERRNGELERRIAAMEQVIGELVAQAQHP